MNPISTHPDRLRMVNAIRALQARPTLRVVPDRNESLPTVPETQPCPACNGFGEQFIHDTCRYGFICDLCGGSGEAS